MIWDLRDCWTIRALLAEADLDYDAFEPEVVARIERATGRAFGFGAASVMEVFS